MKAYFGSIRQWHWISSAICLVGMLLFAITGITLNNAALIQVKPTIVTLEVIVPETVLNDLTLPADKKARVPEPLKSWLSSQGIEAGGRLAEWSKDEMYLSLPRPGGDAWLSIDLAGGEMLYEYSDRGWISYFNDLHKGRNTGKAWSWFLDVFSLACIVFSLTGLVLLHRHAGNRPSTWPMVALGVVIPVVLIILFIH